MRSASNALRTIAACCSTHGSVENALRDLAEEQMGKGGSDRCVELKVYSSIKPAHTSAPYETSFHGEAFAFGNTEEFLIRKVLGVAGGTGWMAAIRGTPQQAEAELQHTRGTTMMPL